ncbi:T9SS type A sorting domain-containing protein, partial [Rubrivirga sp.]|uniref:T9SS type A sorting domain-containing protein n=1 Tax=Rubrivirga sp. TaxID=1885344 RepID=UPI003C7829F7
SITAWPNPSVGAVTVRADRFPDPIRLEVVDALGRVVSVLEAAPERDVALPRLAPGLYTVRAVGALEVDAVRVVVAR